MIDFVFVTFDDTLSNNGISVYIPYSNKKISYSKKYLGTLLKLNQLFIY